MSRAESLRAMRAAHPLAALTFLFLYLTIAVPLVALTGHADE